MDSKAAQQRAPGDKPLSEFARRLLEALEEVKNDQTVPCETSCEKKP